MLRDSMDEDIEVTVTCFDPSSFYELNFYFLAEVQRRLTSTTNAKWSGVRAAHRS
jgi:hypothetical protein